MEAVTTGPVSSLASSWASTLTSYPPPDILMHTGIKGLLRSEEPTASPAVCCITTHLAFNHAAEKDKEPSVSFSRITAPSTWQLLWQGCFVTNTKPSSKGPACCSALSRGLCQQPGCLCFCSFLMHFSARICTEGGFGSMQMDPRAGACQQQGPELRLVDLEEAACISC